MKEIYFYLFGLFLGSLVGYTSDKLVGLFLFHSFILSMFLVILIFYSKEERIK